MGQGPLAYLTAATHGLTEEAERLSTAMGLDPSQLPAVGTDSKVLLPPEPVCHDQCNWPLLTVSKVTTLFYFLLHFLKPAHAHPLQGFFDAPSRPTGPSAGSVATAAVSAADAAAADTAAWGEDDIALDGVCDSCSCCFVKVCIPCCDKCR